MFLVGSIGPEKERPGGGRWEYFLVADMAASIAFATEERDGEDFDLSSSLSAGDTAAEDSGT